MSASVLLKRLLIGATIIIVLLLAVSFTLPNSYQIERSITITDADQSGLYAAVADLNSWPHWASWFQNDPNMQVTMGEQTQGKGAKLSWSSPSQGKGALEIIKVEPNRSVQYRVNFIDYDMQAVGTISFDSSANGVKAVWRDQGELGDNPINRYFGLFLDSMIGPSLQVGLNNLAKFADKKPNTAN